MEYRRRIIASSPHLSHAEGAVATFSDGTDLPLKSLVVDIEPLQSGTGDPSPTNIRPISGWDAVGVHNGNTVVTTISLGRTVYGGTLNVLTGELVVDRAIVDLGTLTWTYSRVRDFFYVNLTGIKYRADMISSMYKSVGIKTDSQMALEPTGTIGQTLNSTEIKIRNTDYTDAAAFKTAMSGVMLCYELATPITYHLDPQTVRSLVGQNNIFSDTGNVALEYWAHP